MNHENLIPRNPTIERLHEKVLALLVDLGQDKALVATFLEGQGITGIRKEAGHCPVAQYLKANLDPYEVSVGDGRTTCVFKVPNVGPHHNDAHDYLSVSVPNPEAIFDFIHAFDAGKFPTLDAPTEDEPDIDESAYEEAIPDEDDDEEPEDDNESFYDE